MLPIYPEPESRWRWYRAANEVAVEPALRFVRYRWFTLPETGPGSDASPQTTTELLDSPAGRDGFASIQSVSAFDNDVHEQLDEIADRNRIGAIVTHLEFGVDSDRADAQSTLWVRQQNDRWQAAITQRASVRLDDPPDDVVPIEGSPIKTMLLILETVAAQPAHPLISEQRQRIGAVAERALARARAALDRELAPYRIFASTSAR